MEWKVNDMNDVELNRLIQSSDPSNAFSTMRSMVVIRQSEIIAAIENSKVAWFRRLWVDASRLKKMLISCIAVLLFGVFGTTSTLVARNLLPDSWIQSIDESGCDVSGANARLARTGQDSLGTVIEYWTVGSKKSVVDVIIQKGTVDGASGGTLGCGPRQRNTGQPFVSRSGYAMNDQIPHTTFFGWLPIGATGILELSDGSRLTLRPDANGDVLELVDGSDLGLAMVRLYVLRPGVSDPTIINLQPKEFHGE
jgi:hypothetical protein